MTPTATRYVTIQGTTVMVSPKSDDEAKAALKELRHKKKELAWHKRTLLRDKRAAEARIARTNGAKRRRRGFMAGLRAVMGALTAVPRLVSRANANADIGKIERECAAIDETIHHIDSAIIQVQGKLLHR
jgi:hypothetical protein